MDREAMRSITDWLLLASVHHEPVPSQVTADGSCDQVTRPGTRPRGTPNGERGSNKEDRRVAAAAIDSANSRRVIAIWICSSKRSVVCRGHFVLMRTTRTVASESTSSASGNLGLFSKL